MSRHWVVIASLMVGCSDGAPPLDALPLRDALSADPEVIATLPNAARRALAERLEAARAGEPRSEELAIAPAASASATANLVDRAREQSGRDAVMVAAIEPSRGALFVHPVPDTVEDRASQALPPIAGVTATEARALDGKAGAIVAALIAASGARRVERVTGWPAGAIAVGDTIYVNAALLVALAPVEESDGGVAPLVAARAVSAVSPPPRARFIARADDPPAMPAIAGDAPIEPDDNPVAPDGGSGAAPSNDTPSAGSSSSKCGDACDGAASGAELCGGCADACDSSDDWLSALGDCGDGCGDCNVGSRRHARGHGGRAALLLAPLLFLLGRRRGRR